MFTPETMNKRLVVVYKKNNTTCLMDGHVSERTVAFAVQRIVAHFCFRLDATINHAEPSKFIYVGQCWSFSFNKAESGTINYGRFLQPH